MAEPLIVHVTSRSSWRQCRRKYWFAEVAKLVPLAPKFPLIFGTAFHEGIAAFYQHVRDVSATQCVSTSAAAKGEERSRRVCTDAFVLAVQTALQSWDQAVKDVTPSEKTKESRELLAHCVSVYTAYCTDNDDFLVLGVEQPIEVDIQLTRTKVVRLRGTMDLFTTRDPLGKFWVVDHKTAGTMRDVTTLQFDDQMTTYLWMLAQVFGACEVGGAIYSQVHKHLPRPPAVLKNGELSRAIKTTGVTYSSYLEALDAHGLDKSEYADVLQELRATDQPVVRNYIFCSQTRLREFGEQLRQELIDLTSKPPHYYPNPSWDCGWSCDYCSPCETLMEGGDLDVATRFLYEHRDWRAERHRNSQAASIRGKYKCSR
ncbi:MAG TPA: PD-(D/E)XK nuclease family protein [Bacillota bacterium]|nr:PD-(D/E)XK nuclease family protein [Dermatophilaceae bacterium]HOI35791.1 PD-(D/E)XK nuclease family protein [Bacillota bacterium]